MIARANGDLLLAEVGVRVNAVDGLGVMGNGVALWSGRHSERTVAPSVSHVARADDYLALAMARQAIPFTKPSLPSQALALSRPLASSRASAVRQESSTRNVRPQPAALAFLTPRPC